MLRDKITKNISEITNDFSKNKLDGVNVLRSFRALKLTERFSEFKNIKRCGYNFQIILSALIWIVTQKEKTVNSSLSALSEMGICCGKDAYYRLKNKENICWRRILWHIASCFLKETEVNKTEEAVFKKKKRCLIFDDTLLEKTGKRIEKVGKVHDHTDNSFKLGFKMLVALFWDGTSAIPLDFSIIREKGKRVEYPYGMRKKDLRRQFSKKRLKESEGKKRILELDKNKIMLAIQMFYMAVYHCVAIDYVLCDSWFTCEALISAVRSQKVHLIGMYKIVKTKFLYQGKSLTYKEINGNIKEIKRCRRLKLQYKRADVICNGTSLTLFFSRQGNKGDWKVFLTTDTKLSFIELIEIYQIRWSVEVFFKETKQLLNLGGSQSSNFDGQIADTTITLLAYILLTFRYRYDHYESKGALFRAMNAENLQHTLDIRLWQVFVELLLEICVALEKDIDDLLEIFWHNAKTAALIEKMLAPPNETLLQKM